MSLRTFFSLIFLSIMYSPNAFAQIQEPEAYGFRHLQTEFEQDPVDVLILSKKGEEEHIKPVLLFGQGSMPGPLIHLTKEGKPFGTFPFRPDSLLENYHLAIVSKPYIPLVEYHHKLNNNAYVDPETGYYPEAFYPRDRVEYYVGRNVKVIELLRQQKYVAQKTFVLAGHSASAAVMTRLAAESEHVSQLILSSGNPFGRMASMVSKARDRKQNVEKVFEHYRKTIAITEQADSAKDEMAVYYADDYSFSKPYFNELLELDIPVLISYGTADHCAPYNDALRLASIREHKSHVEFLAYPDREHNYFPLDEKGQVNYKEFGWDKVVADWSDWLKNKRKAVN